MYFNGLIFVTLMELIFDGIVACFLPLISLWGNKSTGFGFFVESKLYSC
jgi:hypothetical protein